MNRKKHGMTLSRQSAMWGYIFLLPWIVGLLFVFLMPLILSVVFSFSKITVDNGYISTFTGFENYKTALLSDENFPKYLAESLKNILLDVPVILVFSFFVAILLKEKFHGNALAKFVFFIPVIMASGLFLQLQSNFGNTTTSALQSTLEEASSSVQLLKSLNLSQYLLETGMPPSWVNILTAPVNKIYDIISSSGIQIFIFLAGIHAVPSSLYEAAYVEGSTGWESFWKITFPMVTPMILVNTVYSIIDTFTSVKNEVMQYVYELSFQKFDFGLSGAMSWIYCAALAVILAIVFAFMSRRMFYYT